MAQQDSIDIVEALRAHQAEDPLLGPLFQALHTFADRTLERFFEDTPDMPHPVVAFEKDRRTRLGYYTSRDGYALIHRINLNPFSLRNGAEAAETLAHEMVHLWQAHVGRPCQRNYHGKEFHDRMLTYGIISDGKRGYHKGYEGDTWAQWMEENADLDLAAFLLPGMDAKPTRKLLKLQCPDCGNSVRNRNAISIICGDCHVPFDVIKPAAKKVSK